MQLKTNDLHLHPFQLQIEKFFKRLMLRLATDQSIDMRNYQTDFMESKIFQKCEENDDNIDLSFHLVVHELFDDAEFNQMLYTSSKYEKNEEDDGQNEELFFYVVNFVGLRQIWNLHADDILTFCGQFSTIVKNRIFIVQ